MPSDRPDLDRGYVRVPNRLLEAVLFARFTGTQLRIILALIRLTTGWRRRTVTVTVADLARRTGLSSKGGFRRDLAELIDHGVVLVAEAPHGHTPATLALQPDWTRWGTYSAPADALDRNWRDRPSSNDTLLLAREGDPVGSPSDNAPRDDEAGESDPTGSPERVTPEGHNPGGSPTLTLEGHPTSPPRVTLDAAKCDGVVDLAPRKDRKDRKDREVVEGERAHARVRVTSGESRPPATEPHADPDSAAATRRAPPPPQAPPPSAMRTDLEGPLGLIVAANQGMQANPGLGPDCPPIPHSHGASVQVASDLLADIPLDFARRSIYEQARSYQARSVDDRIRSLKFFDRAVRAAWERELASLAAESAPAPAAGPQRSARAPAAAAADPRRERALALRQLIRDTGLASISAPMLRDEVRKLHASKRVQDPDRLLAWLTRLNRDYLRDTRNDHWAVAHILETVGDEL